MNLTQHTNTTTAPAGAPDRAPGGAPAQPPRIPDSVPAIRVADLGPPLNWADTENEQRAAHLIDRDITTANRHGTAISRNCARVLAAAVHHGPHTALGRFAATGDLDVEDTTSELVNGYLRHYDGMPIGWWAAFDLFLVQEARRGTA